MFTVCVGGRLDVVFLVPASTDRVNLARPLRELLTSAAGSLNTIGPRDSQVNARKEYVSNTDWVMFGKNGTKNTKGKHMTEQKAIVIKWCCNPYKSKGQAIKLTKTDWGKSKKRNKDKYKNNKTYKPLGTQGLKTEGATQKYWEQKGGCKTDVGKQTKWERLREKHRPKYTGRGAHRKRMAKVTTRGNGQSNMRHEDINYRIKQEMSNKIPINEASQSESEANVKLP